MARSNGRKADAPEKRDPIYHVVSIVGDNLNIVRRNVSAKNQEAATDAFVETLPADARKGEFGAFLASSLKSWPYDAEQTVVTRKGAQRQGQATIAAPEPVADPVS